MKKIVFLIFSSLVLVSICSAEDGHIVKSSITPAGYEANHPFVIQQYVCDSSMDADCLFSVKVVASDPILHFMFYVPSSELWTLHCLVTDAAGTAWIYKWEQYNAEGGQLLIWNVTASLSNGDYTLTFIAGAAGGIVVSDQVHFSVSK